MRHLFISIIIPMMLLFLAACKKEPAHVSEDPRTDTIPMLIMQIQKCSRLYAAECHIHKIVTHDDKLRLHGKVMSHDYDISLPLGERKIAIPIDATVKAYVDFGGFGEANVVRRGRKIEVVLPDPRITLTGTRINHAEVRQYVALTRRRFSDEELSSYERQGRQAIIDGLPTADIIGKARESAAQTLIPIIMKAGFAEADITISFRKDLSATDIRKLLDKNTIENEKKE